MKKILVVDDVKGWRDYNSNIMYELFGSDIEIKTAECASEAYNILLQEEPIDIKAVMDEIKELEAKRAELDKEIDVYLRELKLI